MLASRSLFVLALVVLASVVALADVPAQELSILVVNDDGYDRPGLEALATALAELGQVTVAAPAEQQSGTGHGITYRDPIVVRRVPREDGIVWYAVGARPATCTRIALEELLEGPPDLVVSGINHGSNLGIVAYYSGTVAAAREAAFSGLPAIAVSLDRGNDDDYVPAARHLAQLVRQLLEQGDLVPGLLLNVNYPKGFAARPGKTRVTAPSRQPPRFVYERRVAPRGQVYYWAGYTRFEPDAEATDVTVILEGDVSVSPLRFGEFDADGVERLRYLEKSQGSGD